MHLKNVVTRRYARDEYYILKERILNKLRLHINRFNVPNEFPSKESFGDIYSSDFEEFQIDFILLTNEAFGKAIVYFSYSSLGGLIGNVCHKVGLKYSIQGLWMNVHTKEFDPTTKSTKLVLSTKVQEILQYPGYNYETYLRGLDNEKEFFHWITQEKYFRGFYYDEDAH